MRNSHITIPSLGILLALSASGVLAAPDWSMVASKKITLFYPGVSPIEWIVKGGEHSGAKGLRKGESCVGCHEEEVGEMGMKMATGQKIEPRVIKGKAAAIPVTVQAAHDGVNLYLRFSWKQPAGGAEKMDKDNQVKLSVMLDDSLVERANLSGCWETCHQDARSMPDAKDDMKTKYVMGGDVKSKFFDLIQWTSKGVIHDGYVAEKRVMDGGMSMVDAKGEKKEDQWVVTFKRKLAGGGTGDISMTPGKTYNFGFAIHDDHTTGRFHHVSLGYTIGIDAQADVSAFKF
ncbi:ethylbenzene dehydrogenase-related protein [Denitromonas sp.]|uniref:ethylbenzene dehydrogenase-related protein n=1 Tax=Denitromonas sp. TaxID=2734609 RepID=UPI002B00091A|nr:ethylbenzene dehydrogenase-related protein [Denitromonas sp.]